MRRLGLDFDNTIACYDQSFHEVAVSKSLLPASPVLTKRQVKNEVIAIHQEQTWTWLQGLVYGPEIQRAQPFPGVLDFIAGAAAQGWEISIVSHKTRHPVIGEPWDLHSFALQWLEEKGFFARGLSRQRVFFELTREAKLERIGSLQCQIFVDDLPEVFRESAFPAEVQRWLHHPGDPLDGPWRQFGDWQVALSWLS